MSYRFEITRGESNRLQSPKTRPTRGTRRVRPAASYPRKIKLMLRDDTVFVSLRHYHRRLVQHSAAIRTARSSFISSFIFFFTSSKYYYNYHVPPGITLSGGSFFTYFFFFFRPFIIIYGLVIIITRRA